MGENKSSIESSGYPLAFRVNPDGLDPEPLPLTDGVTRIRTFARALKGMQKEAVIQYGPTGAIWRVVCDEGPWLNGTDLAPFPLAYFTAGVAASLMEDAGGSLQFTLDNFFTMQGSALRGTMAASVMPMRLSIPESAIRNRSAAMGCLQDELPSRFAVRVNDQALDWPGEAAGAVSELSDPAALFDGIQPISNGGATLIRKIASVDNSAGNAVGLGAEQKRVVHVSTEASIRDDGLKSLEVQCIQPAGSRFQLLSDRERAPGGLAYFSAGVAFCFMTQIGRYAQITKQQLKGYRIVQDTAFRLSQDDDPQAFAVETLVCLDTEEPEDKSIQLVRMAEQTCYIHASYRSATEILFTDP